MPTSIPSESPSVECQTLNPPVRPVCPEAPVWPVEPLAPASSHNASRCVKRLPFSAKGCDSSSCLQTSHLKAPSGMPDSEPTCETRLPRSPGLACGAACPCKQSQVLTLCHKPPLLRKALIICHACIHPNGTPETAPTCETRLPGSPCLACGAACPCKHSQCLTLGHMPPLLCTKP